MSENELLFQRLVANGQLPIARGAIFSTHPLPLPAEATFDCVEGMMLGLAVGDALGVTTEGMLPAERRRRCGEIRDYIPNRYCPDPIGFPSDDTQLSFWTLEQMLAHGGLTPEHVAERFCQGRIFGIGSAVREFTSNWRSGKRLWYECGAKSAGNGALMRIAPVVIPYLRSPSTGLWVDSALCAMITHNDSASVAACVAFVAMLWELLGTNVSPEPEWWLDRFVQVAADLERDHSYRPRGGDLLDYEGTLSEYVKTRVRGAWSRRLSTLDACNSW